jgi:hypothetical protein
LQDHYARVVLLELIGGFFSPVVVDASHGKAIALFDAVGDPFVSGHSVNAFQNAMTSAVM